MKIAVIDNFDSFVYNLVRYLREIPGVEVLVQRNHAPNYAELDQADALLLSPGPGIPVEAGELIAIIDRYHQQKPMLGVCLGHQALGEYFGAELVQSKEPLHGKSTQIEQLKNSSLYDDIDNCLEVGRYHSWKVSNLIPSCLEVTALCTDGDVMSLKHQTLPLEGVQYHPESILTPEGRKLIANWVKSIQQQ